MLIISLFVASVDYLLGVGVNYCTYHGDYYSHLILLLVSASIILHLKMLGLIACYFALGQIWVF